METFWQWRDRGVLNIYYYNIKVRMVGRGGRGIGRGDKARDVERLRIKHQTIIACCVLYGDILAVAGQRGNIYMYYYIKGEALEGGVEIKWRKGRRVGERAGSWRSLDENFNFSCFKTSLHPSMMCTFCRYSRLSSIISIPSTSVKTFVLLCFSIPSCPLKTFEVLRSR